MFTNSCLGFSRAYQPPAQPLPHLVQSIIHKLTYTLLLALNRSKVDVQQTAIETSAVKNKGSLLAPALFAGKNKLVNRLQYS